MNTNQDIIALFDKCRNLSIELQNVIATELKQRNFDDSNFFLSVNGRVCTHNSKHSTICDSLGNFSSQHIDTHKTNSIQINIMITGYIYHNSFNDTDDCYRDFCDQVLSFSFADTSEIALSYHLQIFLKKALSLLDQFTDDCTKKNIMFASDLLSTLNNISF